MNYRITGNIREVQISFSVYQNENLTHETYVMMGGVKWTEQKLNTRISWR